LILGIDHVVEILGTFLGDGVIFYELPYHVGYKVAIGGAPLNGGRLQQK